MLKKIFIILGFVLSALILAVSVKGNAGNPTEKDLLTSAWQENGPFELSPERGRFALTYSLVENKSFSFSLPLARFVIPDLGYLHGRYVSLFAPAVSYLAIPGYYLGRLFNASQVGSFAVIAFFALLNSYLIYLIVRRLGISPLIAFLAGFIFLFATPAYAYASTLYQHHISTFLVLLSVYLLFSSRSWWSLAIVWFLCAFSIPVDYPNLIFMLPIGLYGLSTMIRVKEESLGWKVKVSFKNILSLATILFPLAFFLWFNYQSYGNPLQFSGTVASVHGIDAQGLPINSSDLNPNNINQLAEQPIDKSAVGFFKTRYFLNGLYILLFSPDRGLIFFAPILLFGIWGAFILSKTHRQETSLLVAIIVANLILYCMWGDPWGGWAFGGRYLIPSYAILAVLTAAVVNRYRQNLMVLALFAALAGYSIYLNTSGALSSNLNPPQIEVLELEKLSGHEQKYTYQRNLDELKYNTSKSFFYSVYANRYMSPWLYFQITAGLLISISSFTVLATYLESRKA